MLGRVARGADLRGLHTSAMGGGMVLTRGDVVAVDGSAFLLWGRTGPCAHLMPLSCAPSHPRVLRVKVFPDAAEGDAHVTLFVNTEARRHAPLSGLAREGYVPASDLDAIARAIDAERRDRDDLAERRRAKNIMRAARAARARANRGQNAAA